MVQMQPSLFDFTVNKSPHHVLMKDAEKKGISGLKDIDARFEIKYTRQIQSMDLGPKRGVRFAHTADCHLGAFKDAILREYNIKAFETFIDKCIAMGVDFILIAGDLFHTNIPAIDIARRCGKALLKAKSHGIRVYVLYGSHDYSITERSMIDLFHGVELFHKVGYGTVDKDNILHLDYINDPTGFKIMGITARKGELDREYYSMISQDEIDSITGNKIFMFHITLQEMKLDHMEGEFIPMSMLPRNFGYYAGGHIHKRTMRKYNGSYVIYPGPLFGSEITDLETACEVQPGFYIIDFFQNEYSLAFFPTEMPQIAVVKFNANGLTSVECNACLDKWSENFDPKDKIIILHIFGQLSAGRKTDINLRKIGDLFINRGAITFYPNRSRLKNPEDKSIKVDAMKGTEEIENLILNEIIAPFKDGWLKGSKGVAIARELMRILGNTDYTKSNIDDIIEEVYRLLEVKP